jgi:hypothetical protein
MFTFILPIRYSLNVLPRRGESVPAFDGITHDLADLFRLITDH